MITRWDEQEQAGITLPEGFRAAAARAGLKTQGADLSLIVSDHPATVAGVFTQNQVQASCVRRSRRVVSAGTARAIVCNAGNANACNGEQGDRDDALFAAAAARVCGFAPEEVLTASTGIIGHPLPVPLLEAALPAAAESLRSGAEVDLEVAGAMMTTDTRPKQYAAESASDAWTGTVRFGGVCKGSGMIAPNMATMLCFLTTDARIPAPLLQAALTAAVAKTFNRITVDGDTSTNDMVLLLANGAGGVSIEGGAALVDFQDALERICLVLAKEIARDGEGATKLVQVIVEGARSESDAAMVAKTIAESPLVKTALFGCDPNWGRILMAAGRAGVPFDLGRVQVRIGDIPVFQGSRVEYDEKQLSAYLSRKEVAIAVQLGQGAERAAFWTCDYSYDYIRINAEYHT